jgi:ubiquitin-protein ligase
MASTSTSSLAAASLLRRQLKEMQAAKDLPGISCGLVNDNNIFEWEVMLMISDDCKYYGGKQPTNPQHSHLLNLLHRPYLIPNAFLL